MKLDLFVDTSRKGISMAVSCVSEDGSTSPLYAETVNPDARGETASALMDELLSRVGATLDDVKRVMVTLGPGSFSGLRTGVAFCQGICFSGKRALYGVSTLQALECFADSTDAAVVIRARNGYWYLRQTVNGSNEENFIETAEVVARLKANPAKSIVVDEAALADEALKALFTEIGATTTVDAGQKLDAWSKLFDVVKPSLIQEANYIQPSYFEKLH